jgi:hypothetical protein
MELTKKEIELFILTRISQKREVSEKDFNHLFSKHTVIVRKGKKFLILLSFLTLLAAIYLIHLESANRHLQSPGSRIIVAR